MEELNGVYIMRVASMLTGMHPQTLRKYERAGLLAPSRNKAIRMYSEEDIARLKSIKYLVSEVGLNLAGVRLALKLQSAAQNIKRELEQVELNDGYRGKISSLLNEMLNTTVPKPQIN